MLEWLAQDIHVLKHYTIDLNSTFSIVIDFERILDRAQRQELMRAILSTSSTSFQLRLRNSAYAHIETNDVLDNKIEIIENEPIKAQDREIIYRMRQWSLRLY